MRTSRTLVIGMLLAGVALGAAGFGQDVPTLADQAASEDATERQAAFDALRELGKAGALGLLDMLVPQGEGNDAGARIALHGLAVRLSAPGEPDGPRAEFAATLAGYLETGADAQCRNFAIAQLHICGRAESVVALVAMLEEEELASTAVQALAANPSEEVLAGLREALGQTQGATKVEVIQALGVRQDRSAVALLREEAKSEDPDVRIAALWAIGAIGHVEDFDALNVVRAALTAADEREQQSAFDAWLRLAEAFTALGEGDDRHLYVRALQAAANPQQRQAALLGLGKVGGRGDVREILPYLTDAEPDVRLAAQQALVTLPAEGAGNAIAEATRAAEGDLRAQLLVVLSQREEPAARAVIEEGLRSEDAAVRVRALELLGRLGEPEFRETLLTAAKLGPGSPTYTVALDAYMDQAAAVRNGGNRDEARAMYATALDLAQTTALRNAALDGIASVAHADALPLVQPYLDDAEVRNMALKAYVAIGAWLAGQNQNDEAIKLLRDALDRGLPREALGSAVATLRGLGVDVDPAKESGFVSHWWVLGPFTGDDVNRELPPEQAVDLGAAVETDGRQLAWTHHQTADPTGIVNLAGMLSPSNNVTAYLYAEVTVAEAQDILLKSGSDDRLRIWLNDAMVLTFAQPRSLQVDQDSTEAQLKAGTNRILMKVTQGGGGWEACLRLTDRDGKPVDFEQKAE